MIEVYPQKRERWFLVEKDESLANPSWESIIGKPASFPPSSHTHETSGGDVFGPASATDSAIALYDGVTGKLIKDLMPTLLLQPDSTFTP